MNTEQLTQETQWLSVKQAAMAMGVSADTVRRRISAGVLVYKREGKLLRISAAGLREYEEARTFRPVDMRRKK